MDNVQPMDGLDFLSLAVTAVVSYLVLFLLTKLVGNKHNLTVYYAAVCDERIFNA